MRRIAERRTTQRIAAEQLGLTVRQVERLYAAYKVRGAEGLISRKRGAPSNRRQSVRAQASQHVMLDVMKLGGVTGWMRAAALAHASGLPASSHAFPEFSSHLLGHADGPLSRIPRSRRADLKQPVRIKDGNVLISEEPGAGIEWNEELIARIVR